MTVKVYRLTSGEDIISDADIDSRGYTFNNPAQIIMQQTQDGRVGAAFAPFAPYAKDQLQVSHSCSSSSHSILMCISTPLPVQTSFQISLGSRTPAFHQHN